MDDVVVVGTEALFCRVTTIVDTTARNRTADKMAGRQWAHQETWGASTLSGVNGSVTQVKRYQLLRIDGYRLQNWRDFAYLSSKLTRLTENLEDDSGRTQR